MATALARQQITSAVSAPAVPASTGSAYVMPWSPVGTTPPMRPSPIRPIAVLIKGGSPSPLIHVAVRHRSRGCRLVLRNVRDERLGGEQQRGDGCRVLERHALDLGRVRSEEHTSEL